MNDLVVQLFKMWVKNSCPPDVLSMEWDDKDELYICFEWFNGRMFKASHTKNRYDLIWEEFNNYWRTR